MDDREVTTDPLALARGALAAGDASAARSLLAPLPPTADVLETRASASFVLLEYARALEEMEAAYAAYRAAGDGAGAARVARMLGGMHGSTSGNWAVANGWIARARSLLHEHPDEGERGWVALTQGMFEGHRASRNARLEEALDLGRRTRDPDLTFAALAYLGASLVHDDRVGEGMDLLDEALAATAGGDVASFMVVEEIFCQLFSACEHARDVARAEQWIGIGEQLAERRHLPAVSAYCRTHYGGILTAAGRWREADATLTEALRLWTAAQRTLRVGALVRLAELRTKQGRHDEAATLLEGVEGDDASRARGALHLARGEHAMAMSVLEHALQCADPGSSTCLPLLAMLAEVQLAADEDPAETVAAMAACVEAHPSVYADAMLALARGRTGEPEAQHWLRDALDGFLKAQLPFEAGVCRLQLARACATSAPEVAVAEARVALAAFEELDAARYADEASAVLRGLGEKVGPPRRSGEQLTKREREVVRLIGEGMSNPEISELLFISRKTVEHHVGNILAKLGLRNRAEVVAYAVRREPEPK
jgi:DNA-binding CsgD family transcriptional regulator